MSEYQQLPANKRTASKTAIDRRRYWRITLFFAWVTLHLILWDILLRRLFSGWVLRTRPQRFRMISRRFRHLAIEMGGVLIKLGQFLSARVDVLPVEITEELQGLQDEVSPEPAAAILAVLRAELDHLGERFAAIEEEPLAAASLGQTYRAWLCDENGERGDGVVIKIQRPNIEHIVRTDLASLRVAAGWAMRYRNIRRRADVPALLDEFAATLWEELDYVAEVANAERFQAMFADNDQVCIPQMYHEHCTGRVIVMENVENIKITDLDALDEAGIDRVDLAEVLLDVYFTMIFKEGFFHADPHPGNLFVKPLPLPDIIPIEAEEDEIVDEGPLATPFQLIFVDFGMVGRVETLMGANLRRVVISISQKDARGLTEAYRDLGFFLPSADFERLVEAQTQLLEQLWGRNLLDLAQPDPREIAEFGQEFRDLLFEFPFQIPQDFIYLGRALGILSGLSSLLNPQINPWAQVERFAEALIATSEGRELGLDLVKGWLKPFVNLPWQVQRVLSAAEKGYLKVQVSEDRELLRRMEKLERRLTGLNWGIVAAAAMISTALLYIFRNKDKASGKK